MSGTTKLIRFSILGKIFPNSAKRVFIAPWSVFICRTGENTVKAIERRQRGTEGHRGAFWSIGRGRTAPKYKILIWQQPKAVL